MASLTDAVLRSHSFLGFLGTEWTFILDLIYAMQTEMGGDLSITQSSYFYFPTFALQVSW